MRPVPDRSLMKNILIIEDHRPLLSMLASHLQGQGYAIRTATTGRIGLALLQEHSFDALILDLGLPDMDGMEILAQLHRPDRSQRLPCLILSARDAVHNRIQGLRGGADDYLLKPFDLVELEARLSAILRRAAPHRYQQLVIANLRFEPEVRQAWVNDQALMLPRRESVLLQELMQASPRLLIKDYLLEQLYQSQTDISLNAIEALISKLRRKLREQNALVCIDTVRGVGYRLRAL